MILACGIQVYREFQSQSIQVSMHLIVIDLLVFLHLYTAPPQTSYAQLSYTLEKNIQVN